MNIKLIPLLLAFALAACSNKKSNPTHPRDDGSKLGTDTIVVRNVAINDSMRWVYREGMIDYYAVMGRDTLDYIVSFYKEPGNGQLTMISDFNYLKPTFTYRQRFSALHMILAKAALDFNLDSLSNIYLGSFNDLGDLTFDVSRQYQQKFGTLDKLQQYDSVMAFLKTSRLGTELNDLFRPYSLTVENIGVEKLWLRAPVFIYQYSKMETDTTKAPPKILEGSIRAYLKRQ